MEPVAAAPTASSRQRTVRPDLVEVVHLLVLVQGSILVARSIEAVFFLAFSGVAATVSLGLTAVAAVLTLATAAALGRGSRRARGWTLIAESGVLAVGVVDLLLALAMTGEPLGPVALLVGLVLPAAVIVLLRRR
jgi:hypothetical protein